MTAVRPARDTTHLLELLLVCPVPVVRRLQLGGHVGRAPGVGRAGACSLLAARHAGPAVTATEGLGRRGLAGEQSSMAQASRTGGPEPLLILVVLLVLVLIPVLVPVPQVFLQLLFLLLLFPFRLPGVAEGRGQRRGASSPPPGKAGSSSSLGFPLAWLLTGPAALSPVNPDDRSRSPGTHRGPCPCRTGRPAGLRVPGGACLGAFARAAPATRRALPGSPGPRGPSPLQGALCPPL